MASGLLTTREAADLLRVSERTIRRWGVAGILDRRRIGPKLIRITVESVVQRIEGQNAQEGATLTGVAPSERTPFGTADLAEFAAEYGGDAPLRIASHGESYSIAGWSWDPREGVITILGDCPGDRMFCLAASYDDDPEATAAMHHRIAEETARHLEEIAARIRAEHPVPAAR
jgi:excisionase family DNA binding protein